jgi:hypothetical protein
MDKILGMPIRPKVLTDSEHVETIRRQLNWQQRFGKWLALLTAAGSVVFFVVAYKLILMLGLGGVQVGNVAIAGFIFGAFLGFVFGLFVWRAAEQFVRAIVLLKPDRASVLLVKYHDMLVKIAETQQAHSPRSEDGVQRP